MTYIILLFKANMTYAVNRHNIEIWQNIKHFQVGINDKYVMILAIFNCNMLS